MRRLLNRRRALVIGVLALALPALVLVALRAYSALRARDQVYTVESVPPRPVAIIFGAQVHADGRLSHMLSDRVAAGAALYHAGKIEALLLTGDNRFVTYNEPEAMRRYARSLGVPDGALVLDYAGRSTYDSCYRARVIFGVSRAILVTQGFHLDRALLTCNTLGVESVGVAADAMRPEGYNQANLTYSVLREFPATAKAVIDLVRRPQPVLGEPLPIVTEAAGQEN